MASGSSAGRAGSKGFDFGSDDILCSYEDYGSGAVPGLNNNHDSSNSNGAHSDPVPNPAAKDFNRSRLSRSSGYSVSPYSQPDDSFSQDVISIVEKSMKKHTDNVMRFLEGISSRLSQLELYCYNLDKSIGEMRSDLVRDHGEADSKLKSLEKHVQEVHRSVQILRDKQELADAQKELAKLQLAQKESSSSAHSHCSEEKATPTASDPKKSDNPSEANNQQLALALPHPVVPQQQPPPVPTPSQALPQNLAQQQTYYLPPAQLPAQVPTPPTQTQHTQNQYVPSDPQYRTQVQAPQPAQAQVNQTAPAQQYPQYQQQWPQQLPQQVQPPQQASMQPQMRPPSTTVYPTYPPPGQPATPAPPEALPSSMPMQMPSSMPMQMPYSAIPQPLSSRAESIPYGYGAGRAGPPQPPSQQIKASFGLHPGDGYATGGSHPALPPPPVSAYMMYDSEAGRTHLPPQQSRFSQSGYPPTNLSLQGSQPAPGTNMLGHNPSPTPFMRNHPYGELIDKLASMGFRGDHVVSVIQRMEESGQPVDFNSVLDRLNVHSSAGGQRGWSG